MLTYPSLAPPNVLFAWASCIIRTGTSRSLGGHCGPSAHSSGICTGFQINVLPSPGAWAGVRAWDCSPPLRLSPPVSACLFPFPTSISPLPKAPQPCSHGSSRPEQTWEAGAGSSSPGRQPGAFRGWRRTGPGRKRGLLGPPRPLGQRPPPARATVGPVPWVSLRWARVSYRVVGGGSGCPLPSYKPQRLGSCTHVLVCMSPAFKELMTV